MSIAINRSKSPVIVNWPLASRTYAGLRSVNHVAVGNTTLCGRDVPVDALAAKTKRIDCPVCFKRFEKGEV